MKVVQIHKDDTMDEVQVTSEKELVSHTKSQGEGQITCLYTWKYEDHLIRCYGWYDGEAGFENKHELPPGGASTFIHEDSSIQLLYGDLFLMKCEMSSEMTDFDISEYSEFYNLSFGGFEELDDEDMEDTSCEEEEDELSEASDTDYQEIIDVQETEPEISGEGELEEDTHVYG